MATDNEKSGKRLKYMRVRWVHEDPYEPIDLYYEIKEDNWAMRVIEVYGDGSVEVVDPQLLDSPVPSLKDINAMPDFRGKEISKDEFEYVWNKRSEGDRGEE